MSEELRRDLYEEYKYIKEEYGAYDAKAFAEDCGADFTDLIKADEMKEAEFRKNWVYPF